MIFKNYTWKFMSVFSFIKESMLLGYPPNVLTLLWFKGKCLDWPEANYEVPFNLLKMQKGTSDIYYSSSIGRIKFINWLQSWKILIQLIIWANKIKILHQKGAKVKVMKIKEVVPFKIIEISISYYLWNRAWLLRIYSFIWNLIFFSKFNR